MNIKIHLDSFKAKINIKDVFFRYCNENYVKEDLHKKFFLVAIPKDKKKGGNVCSNDSGSGLILKRGNRFVQIGRFFELKKHRSSVH